MEGYEHRLPPEARKAIAVQTSLAAHDIRNRPDLNLTDSGSGPTYLDVKTTTFRLLTGNVAVELYPVWRAWTDWNRIGTTTYFDLDGWLCRIDHLRDLVKSVVIPSNRWPAGSAGFDLYRKMVTGGCHGHVAIDPLPEKAEIRHQAVSSTNASGDPFVLVPRGALSGRVWPQAARTEDFICRKAGYKEPNLSWPAARVSMCGFDWSTPLPEAALALDFAESELRPLWEKKRSSRQ